VLVWLEGFAECVEQAAAPAGRALMPVGFAFPAPVPRVLAGLRLLGRRGLRGLGPDTSGALEVAAAWMSGRASAAKNDIYTIAGSATGAPGVTGDGGPATSGLLNGAGRIASDAAGNLYIGDGSNRRIQEIPATNSSQWGQQMHAGYMYTVAGSAAGVKGESGDGGPAAAALMSYAMGVSIDYSGNLYITDMYGGRLREVVSAGNTPFFLYPTPGSTINGTFYPGGVTVTHANGSQATFYPKPAGGWLGRGS